MTRKILLVGVFIVILGAIALYSAQLWYSNQISQPLNISEKSLFTIEAGQSSYQVLAGIRKTSPFEISPSAAKLWLKYSFNNTVKQGVYELSPSMSLSDVFNLFASGEQKQFSITLIEGLRWKDWLSQLKLNPLLFDDWNNETENLMLSHASQVLAQPILSLEGVLLADTYYFVSGTKISDIVNRALAAMGKQLNKPDPDTVLPQELSDLYEVLILSSIVEKESAKADERALIAGVFLNRLNKNMRLQTDPTIIYGLGDEFDGDIKREHIKRPTAYNTYVIKGLPPTPIAMVGREAIEAVWYATPSEYLYFVSKGDGSSFFSTSLSEHNRAVRQYQLGIQ